MQTFVPELTIKASVDALDPRRKNNQVNEAMVMVRTLTEPGFGWPHHPAVLMWRDHLDILALYGAACALSWSPHDNRRDFFLQHYPNTGTLHLPWWWSCSAVHVSHRLNLWWKDPNYYTQYRRKRLPRVQPAYAWPVHHDEYEIADIKSGDKHPIATVYLTRYKTPRRIVGYAMDDQTHLAITSPKPSGKGIVTYLLQTAKPIHLPQ